MAKLTLNNVANGGPTGVAAINENNGLIETAIENTLSRDGTLPNQMNADLDMNNNDVINVDSLSTNSLSLNGTPVVPLDLGSFAENSVDTIQLVNESVTEPKLADGAVSTRVIADEAVTTTKMENGAVTESKLADAVTLLLSKPVADRTAMKAIDTNRYNIALMEGRVFYWDGSDLSTEVTADPGEGIYVAPSDGLTGAWVAADDTSKGYIADWWGVVGDGVTDDTTAITNAMGAVAALGGGDLILPKMVALSSTVVVPPFVNLVSYTGGGIKFLAGATGNGLEVSEDTELRGIKFDGNGTSKQVIAPLNTARRLKFIRCEIYGSTSNGIFLQQGAQNILIDDCYIHDVGLAGVNVSGLTVTGFVIDITVQNCHIENCGRSGVVVGGVGETTTQTPLYATDVKVLSCRIINVGTVSNPKSSISIPYIDGFVVDSNYCDTSGEHGIAGQENSKGTLSNNICINHPFGGMSFQSGFDPFNPSTELVITSNMLTDNDWGAIFRDKVTNSVMTGNYLRGNTSGSIRLFDSDGPSDSIVGAGNQITPSGISNENTSTNISIT